MKKSKETKTVIIAGKEFYERLNQYLETREHQDLILKQLKFQKPKCRRTKNSNTMNETVLQRIIAFIFGHKYYANIIRTYGLGGTVDLTSFIHPTKADAIEHRKVIAQTASFEFVETISFRSHETYVKTVSPEGERTGQQIK